MTQTVERMLPLYEGKMIHHFDHRWSTYEADGTSREITDDEKRDPDLVALPRYWIREEVVRSQLESRWAHDWLVGYRWVSNATNERTFVSAAHPTVPTGNSEPLILAPDAMRLLPVFCSFVFDYATRQMLGGQNLTFTLVQQLPVPGPDAMETRIAWLGDSPNNWLADKVVRLVHTATDTHVLAVTMADSTGPFLWDKEARRGLQSEIDALMFHVYGIDRGELEYIMDTFPIVRRNDERASNEYRTKRLILESYDAMQRAIDTGVPYRSPWDSESLGEENE